MRRTVGGSGKKRGAFIPFGKPNFSDREIAAVTRVLRSGWVGMGPETLAFEKELADYVGIPHMVTVNSCTSALFLSLLALGVKAGDEVICPSFTWCSTANAALYLGAKPVFCDIDPESFCVTPEYILAKVTPKTTAVIVVHFGGLAVDVKRLRALLPKKISIVEDAAHAFGARYPDGRMVGSSGNLTCFSFYANKNLSTGEGGAVALRDRRMAERLRSLRQHGLSIDAWKRFIHPQTVLRSNQLTDLGYKMNYTDLQASLGRIQLARQVEFQKTRQRIADRYVERLSLLKIPLAFQRDGDHPSHSKHLFILKFPLNGMKLSRNEILLRLRAKNIGACIHYDPLHMMPLYAGGGTPPALPMTEGVARSIITLPISSSMTVQDADNVVDHLSNILGGST